MARDAASRHLRTERPVTARSGRGQNHAVLNDNNVLEYEMPMAAIQNVSESGTVTGHGVSQFNAPESADLAEGERLLASVPVFSTGQQP